MNSLIKYIDIHGHISDHDYDVDRDEVIKRATEAGVGMIAIGTDLESSRGAVALAEKHANVWATVGMHPTDSMSSEKSMAANTAANFDYAEFKKLAENSKVVAIGECGLDYFRPSGQAPLSEKESAIQHEIFLKHIDLANEVKKPLMLHMRSAGNGAEDDRGTKSAYTEAVAILKERAKVPANFHFFAGTVDDAKVILDIGGTLSFTGVVTFARNYDEVIKYIPLERIMSETDCPFVSPKPYRGKRNEPAYVVEVVKAIAAIRGDGEVAVVDQLRENAVNFFGINIPS